MKKTLLFAVMGIMLCLCGCSKNMDYITKYIADVDYVTKYITNCESTEFRAEPVNGSTVIYELKSGDAVSFEKDAKNGYSKVIYEGVTGYVLSANLTSEKPVKVAEDVANNNEKPVVKENTPPQKKDTGLTSNYNAQDVENYITTFVRPLYNNINSNINSYSKQTSGSATMWYDSKGCIKKELPQGADNYNMSRQYYYDTNSGEMVFAFVFQGNREHRLYFKQDKLVRYIDESGNIINNPTSVKALELAEHAIYEAY